MEAVIEKTFFRAEPKEESSRKDFIFRKLLILNDAGLF